MTLEPGLPNLTEMPLTTAETRARVDSLRADIASIENVQALLGETEVGSQQQTVSTVHFLGIVKKSLNEELAKYEAELVELDGPEIDSFR